MNDFCGLFQELKNGNTIVLEKDKTYHVYQDDCFVLNGYYCSNTAKKHQNPDGTRYSALFLKDKSDVVIDGNGATLMVHGVMTPILLDRCQNITVKNLTVDYARPSMSEMQIVSNDDGVCVLKIHDESLFEVRGNVLYWQGEKDRNGKPYWENSYRNDETLSMIFNPKTELLQFCVPSIGAGRPSIPEFESVERIDGQTIKVSLKQKELFFPVGSIVQCRSIVRNQLGSFFVHCKNLKLENMHIKSMHGFGMLCQYCEDVHYNGLDCMPKVGRTITSCADVFHFSGCKGNILIENCKAQGAHDDFVNVHGTFLRIVEIDEKNKRLLVRFMNAETWGFDAFFVGDDVGFTKWNTMTTYATASVLDAQKINDTDILLTLSDLPTDIEVGKDALENLTWRPTLTVRNNYFGYTCAHGILCAAADTAIIENNVFYHNELGACSAGIDCNFWFESGVPDKIVFRNNQIIHCGTGWKNEGYPVVKISPKMVDETRRGYVYPYIAIYNNRFLESPQGGYRFEFLSVDNVILKDNCFDGRYQLQKEHVNALTDEGNLVE